jgi:hypothetical protein
MRPRANRNLWNIWDEYEAQYKGMKENTDQEEVGEGDKSPDRAVKECQEDQCNGSFPVSMVDQIKID